MNKDDLNNFVVVFDSGIPAVLCDACGEVVNILNGASLKNYVDQAVEHWIAKHGNRG